jgi:DNA-binding transcriptional regulator YdaS (Cro superfamily)
MQTETPVEALQAAVAVIGSQSQLASELSKRSSEPVSQARVWNWINRDGGAPSEVCPDIEDLTGISCERLCPSTNWAVLRRKKRAANRTTQADAEKAGV